MAYPSGQKIYHILHYDRLPSLLSTGFLYSDKYVRENNLPGSKIGYQLLKDRRLTNFLSSYQDLAVGACVPFYFCPRSVMLYTLDMKAGYNDYQEGQNPIVHLEFDLTRAISWAVANKRRWVLTTGNASTRFFDDFSTVEGFARIDWQAIAATQWKQVKDQKQAEFLVEESFPLDLVECLGINRVQATAQQVSKILTNTSYASKLQYRREWYY
jgi:hypothetical protein